MSLAREGHMSFAHGMDTVLTHTNVFFTFFSKNIDFSSIFGKNFAK